MTTELQLRYVNNEVIANRHRGQHPMTTELQLPYVNNAVIANRHRGLHPMTIELQHRYVNSAVIHHQAKVVQEEHIVSRNDLIAVPLAEGLR